MLASCCCWVSLSVASTRWCCWCILYGLAAGPVTAAPTEGKQAHITIMISANCGDGSVTGSFDMLHIVSITPNCCSRPWHRKILKMLCIWSCGLLWNWKWMVINYNDDHHGERFCATGYLTMWVYLCKAGLKRKAYATINICWNKNSVQSDLQPTNFCYVQSKTDYNIFKS